MHQSIKILIIDDHRLFNDGVKMMLSDIPNIEIIKQLSDAHDAINVVLRLNPDIVLMDYSMPNMNGLEATQLLLSHFSNLKIIFLSMSEDSHLIERFYQSGGYGYLSKTATKEVFLDVIHKVLNGNKYFPSSILDDKKTLLLNGVKLTKREVEIAEKVKLGLTTKQIAEFLNISYYTAETHRKNIIIKLGLRGEKELYKYLINL